MWVFAGRRKGMTGATNPWTCSGLRLLRAALLLLAVSAAVPRLLGCASVGADPAETEKEVVRGFLEDVFNTGDVALLPRFVAPDYVEVYRGEVHPLGIDGAREHVLGVRRAFPDLRLTVERQFAEGEWVVSCVTVRGTHLGEFVGAAPTGEVLEFTGINVNRVVDGRIVSHEGVANLLAPLLEAGAIRLNAREP